MISPIGRLRAGATLLHELPMQFAGKVVDDQYAWGMHLSQKPTFVGQHGVYSTSFAIQLLCDTTRLPNDHTVQLITGGMRYLHAQYHASAQALSFLPIPSRQQEKFQQVGHTDFLLVMKLVTILNAANAISAVRDQHRAYGAVLHECDEMLNEVAAKLKDESRGRGYLRDGALHRGWPWHIISASSTLDVLPTIHAVSALTHPNLRASSRYLDDIAPVINYLREMLSRADVPLLHKAMIYRTFYLLRQRFPSAVGEQDLRDAKSHVLSLTPDIDQIPWQEVLHYPVPESAAARAGLSHYKPWIWLCPRIELAEALLLCEDDQAASMVASSAALLVNNIRRNSGFVKFLVSQEPTLLATFKASQFLDHYLEGVVAKPQRQMRYIEASARVRATDLISRFPWIILSLFFALVWVTLDPPDVDWGVFVGWNDFATLAGEVARGVWRGRLIWILLLAGTLILGKGSVAERALMYMRILFSAIVLGLVVEILGK
jgi:hypothetical protein